MAKISTRNQFTDYCLRRLGYPVIDINVDDEQVQDRIDDALQFYQDYHYDGNEKVYMKHQFTQEDIDRRWIYCPDSIISVTQVFPWDDSGSSVGMFDLRYQLRLNDLYDFTSISYVSYTITMQHLRTLSMLFSGTPQYRFNRHLNKLYLDIDWNTDAQVGKYAIMECYRAMTPDTITLSGTITSNTTYNTMVEGVNTKFTQELIEGDVIHLSTGEDVQVNRIAGDGYMTFYKPPVSPLVGASMTKLGVSDVWNDRFLKQYATAKIKLQWGQNLSKYSGIQLPGGVTLDGNRISQEAQLEIDKLEEEMHIYNVLPSEMFIG